MTNRRPSLELANLKSISVPPRSAMDTGTCYTNKKDDNMDQEVFRHLFYLVFVADMKIMYKFF